MQVTLTPKYIDQPKPGKKNWSVKDTSDVYYSFPPDLAVGLQVGQPVTIDYRLNNFQGKTFNIVERVYGASAAAQQSQAPAPAPSQPRPTTSAPAAPARNGNGHSTAREIFITGIVGRAMGSGKFEADAILELARNAAEAWDALVNGLGTRNNGGPDDPIPF